MAQGNPTALIRFLLWLCLLGPGVAWSQPADPAWKFRLPDVLQEVSGLAITGTEKFWWLNDNDHPPTLYRTDGRGRLVDSIYLQGALNRDWEDLSTDNKGYFYIGDTGNNCNCRRDLRIYRYLPDSGELDSILFRLPDQGQFPPEQPWRNFDLEAFFWWNDSLHLFSKNTLKGGNFYTKHYVLPDSPGNHVAELRDSLFLKKRVVTAAAISDDGQTVALLAYHFRLFLGFIPSSKANVFFLEDYPAGHFLQGKVRRKGIPPYFIATQWESVDFMNPDAVYVASERTLFIRPKARRIRR